MYPDVSVVRGKPEVADDQNDILLNPTVIVEVLSPSTEAHDRGLKFARYRRMESLREYVLVSQEAPHVEVFRRQEDGHWVLTEYFGLDSVCRLESIDCAIPLAGIYERVEFTPDQLAE
jgi:Uma2 family endonuclease